MTASVAAPKRGQRKTPLAGRIFGLFTPHLNRYVVRVAGSPYVPIWSLLRHHGRVSGREYATPVTAFRVADGFAIPLAFGERSSWCRNILASGEARLRSRGHDLRVIHPVVLDVASPRLPFAAWERMAVSALGVRSFLFVEVASE